MYYEDKHGQTILLIIAATAGLRHWHTWISMSYPLVIYTNPGVFIATQ